MIIVKEQIPYKTEAANFTAPNDSTTETLSISIPMQGNRQIQLTNVYVPPIRRTPTETRTQNFNPDFLPHTMNAIVLGDFNAHAALWDDHIEEDEIGAKVTDWLADENMICLNDGSGTRTDWRTGAQSSPDLSIAHSSLASSLNWAVRNDLASDHLPIIIDLEAAPATLESPPPLRRWNLRKADWTAFEEKVETMAKEALETAGLSTRMENEIFTTIVIKAAALTIPKTLPHGR